MPVVERSHPDPALFASRDDLAAALTILRELSGLTVRDVARAANLPVATAGGYFSGRHLPGLSTLDQFVRVLDTLGLPDGDVPDWVAAVNRLRRAPGPRPATAISPYLGLAAYQPEDADLFFGRERLTECLVARIAAGPSTPLVVIGSSGSGKSSLLRAGLAATLLADGRRVVVATPGADPRTTLAGIATAKLVSGGVLVVDQFEEVFAPDPTGVVVAHFVAGLASLHDAGIVIVLGLRADFFDRLLEVDTLAGWLAENQMLVGPLSIDSLRRVVVEPARVAGIEIDDALVEVLVAEAGAGSAAGSGLEAGALPLLSHALYVTWLATSGRRLTLAQYRAVGGLAGAIAQSAEAVHATLPPDQRAVERGTLLRLVHVRAGVADTRRPADSAGFSSPAESGVVAAYVEARLLTSDRGQLQIAHEALLTAWPRLRSWVDADREGLRAHGRLTEVVQQWHDTDRDPGLLYRGAALDTALTWAGSTRESVGLAAVESEFLDESESARARGAASRRRGTQRLRVLAAGLAVLALSTAGLAGVLLAQNRAVVHDRDLAVSRQLAVTARSLAATDPALAGQIAVAAELTADTVEARTALLSASGDHTVTRLIAADEVINSVRVSPDGATLAVGTEAGRVVLWSTGARPRQIADLPVLDDSLYDVAFSADGSFLTAAGNGGEPSVWDLTDVEHPVSATIAGAGTTATLYDVVFSADGTLLGAAASDGTVHLWSQDARGAFVHVAAIPAFDGTVQALALDASGTVLAAGGVDGLIAVWDVTDPARPVVRTAPFTGSGGRVTSLDLSPDGTTVAAGSTDSLVHLWDVSAPATPVAGPELAGAASWVNDVAFSGDGERLAAASSDKRLWVWHTDDGTLTQSFAHPSTLLTTSWSPDGRSLYTGAADGVVRQWTYPGPTLSGFASIPGQGVFGGAVLVAASTDGIRLWDTADPDNPTLLSLTAAPAGVRLDGAVDVSDSRSLVVAGDENGGLHIWDVRDPARPVFLTSFQEHTGFIEGVTFDPSGTRLAVASDDSSVTLWDLSSGIPDGPASRLSDLGGFAYTASFTPDATTLVVAVFSGEVLIADVTDLAAPQLVGEPLTGPTGYIYGAAISPDGRTIAASGNDKSIWLWDIADRAAPKPLGRPLLWADGYATNVVFSPDGRLLAGGMTDGTVRLWDMTDPGAPERWASLEGIAGTVYGVDFSPDSHHISAAGGDRTVQIWDTDLDDARTEVCASAARGVTITGSEWARIAGEVPRPDLCRAAPRGVR